MIKKSDLNTKFATLAAKARLNKGEDKIMKVKAFYSGYFHSKKIFDNGVSQNMFVYQPTLDTLWLEKDNGTDYVLSWKSKGVYNSKLETLYTAFLHSIKRSG